MVIKLTDKEKESSRSTTERKHKIPPVKPVKPAVKNKSVKKSILTDKETVKSTSSKKSLPVSLPVNKSPNIKKNNLPDIVEDDTVDPLALERGDEPMTIIEHLEELRSRLIIVLASFFILTCIAFYFSDYLVYFINKPFMESGNKLNVFNLAGGFIIKMKVSAALSILILIPLIIFHIWRFISPAIERPERFFSRLTISSAILLFYAGVCFVFLILPSTIKVLLSFVDNSMLVTNGADDYLHFIFFMSFIMGFLCELPIIILILTKMGLITPQFLIRKRKYAVIIIWITAAVVTPGPDLLSQSLVGIPLMFLYEISIVISKLVLIRKKRKELKLRNI